MATRRLPYGVPTLKVTRAIVTDPVQLFQSLTDFSNDIQGFLQRAFKALNDNKTVLDTAVTNISALQKPADSKAANGYVTLPDGIILQWMAGTGNSPGVSNALPLAFPNNIFAAFASPSGAAVALQVGLTDKGHVTVTTAAAGAQNCFIAAVGN